MGKAYFQGQIFFSIANYQKALSFYQQAVQEDPNDFLSWNQIGVCLGQLSDHAGALEAHLRANQVKPDMPEVHLNLGLTYLHLNSLEEAEQFLKSALRLKPDFCLAYYNLGAVYSRQGKPSYAAECYARAVQIQPDYFEALYNLGITYSKLKSWPRAVEALEKAISIRGDFLEAYIQLAAVYERQKNFAAEVEVFRRALEVKPDQERIRYALVLASLRLGDRESALKEFAELKEKQSPLAESLQKYFP